jgi:hypothetical protein
LTQLSSFDCAWATELLVAKFLGAEEVLEARFGGGEMVAEGAGEGALVGVAVHAQLLTVGSLREWNTSREMGRLQ